jgi:hypothetical protein
VVSLDVTAQLEVVHQHGGQRRRRAEDGAGGHQDVYVTRLQPCGGRGTRG